MERTNSYSKDSGRAADAVRGLAIEATDPTEFLEGVAAGANGSESAGDGAKGMSGDVRQVYRSNAPKTFPCGTCGVRGRRVRKRILEVLDLEFHQRVRIIGTVGVYKAKCECCKYFTSEIREASKGTEYSTRVRDEVVRLVTKENLTYESVRERLERDFFITVSIGTIHNWLKDRQATPARSRRAVAGGKSKRSSEAQRVAS